MIRWRVGLGGGVRGGVFSFLFTHVAWAMGKSMSGEETAAKAF